MSHQNLSCIYVGSKFFTIKMSILRLQTTENEAKYVQLCNKRFMRVLQKVLSLGSDYFSATFYLTYFYYKPSKYSPFTETHFCNLFTQSQKADK